MDEKLEIPKLVRQRAYNDISDALYIHNYMDLSEERRKLLANIRALNDFKPNLFFDTFFPVLRNWLLVEKFISNNHKPLCNDL